MRLLARLALPCLLSALTAAPASVLAFGPQDKSAMLEVELVETDTAVYAIVTITALKGSVVNGEVELLVDGQPAKVYWVTTDTWVSTVTKVANAVVSVTACAKFNGSALPHEGQLGYGVDLACDQLWVAPVLAPSSGWGRVPHGPPALSSIVDPAPSLDREVDRRQTTRRTR